MSSSNHPSRSRHTASTAVRVAPPSRPSSINELVERAFTNLWDPTKDFKHWLRVAERSRNTGREYADMGDLESAFVEYAKAATLILDKMPSHGEYSKRLNPSQKESLTLHGQELLKELAAIKPILTERYTKWLSTQASGSNSTLQSDTSTLHQRRPAESEYQSNPIPPSLDTGTRNHLSSATQSQLYTRPLFVNADTLTRDTDPPAPRRLSVQHDRGPRPLPSTAQAQVKALSSVPVLEPDRRPSEQYETLSALKARSDALLRKEQEGILQRQREAEKDAREARQAGSVRTDLPVNATDNVPSGYSLVPVSSLTLSDVSKAPGSAAVSMQYTNSRSSDNSTVSADFPPILPLESPRRYDGDSSTDSEKADYEREKSLNPLLHDRFSNMSLSSEAFKKGPFASLPYTVPITTTSPPPPSLGSIHYPQLMDQHQRTQGYAPSLQSMFAKPGLSSSNSDSASSSLLFNNTRSDHQSTLYNNILPQTSKPIDVVYSSTQSSDSRLPYNYPGPQPSPIKPPPPIAYTRDHGHTPTQANQSQMHPELTYPQQQPRIFAERQKKGPPKKPELRTVYVPKQILPRFLNIAAINTGENRETLGLLLGRSKTELESVGYNASPDRATDKGDPEKFVVTTLLIPKQHSTSDTCAMEEEELVLEYTEARGLIILGWIHTHPSQSCFMSSVDLHTHSGYQCMLPESFAIVCAPRSTPNFGIFRLTDPPGLETILSCTVKNAFHPHPDLPIYTDADKGHVLMREMSIEISDLRTEHILELWSRSGQKLQSNNLPVRQY